MPRLQQGLACKIIHPDSLAKAGAKGYSSNMTLLLERAFASASKLPAPEQDAVASFLLAELDSEQRWSTAFASSQNELAALAEAALREFAAGETKPLDVTRLSKAL